MDDSTVSYKCIHLNVNSLISNSKRHELKTFIDLYKPDMLLLNETKLKPINKLSIPKYNFYRNDRTTDEGGGTAILVKSHLVSTQLQCIPTIASFEHTVVKLQLENNKLIYFAAVYKTPINSINTDEISLLIHSFGNSQYIIAGDFNCKHTFWGNTECNSGGNKLYRWLCDSIDIHSVKLLKTNEPTCIRANSESFIDLFMIDDGINVCFGPNNDKLTTLDFDSDHRAVVLNISLYSKISQNERGKIFNWNKGDYIGMSRLIDERLSELYLPIAANIENNQIDSAVEKINEIFTSSIQLCVPTIEIERNTLIKLSSQSRMLLTKKKKCKTAFLQKQTWSTCKPDQM